MASSLSTAFYCLPFEISLTLIVSQNYVVLTLEMSHRITAELLHIAIIIPVILEKITVSYYGKTSYETLSYSCDVI